MKVKKNKKYDAAKTTKQKSKTLVYFFVFSFALANLIDNRQLVCSDGVLTLSLSALQIKFFADLNINFTQDSKLKKESNSKKNVDYCRVNLLIFAIFAVVNNFN